MNLVAVCFVAALCACALAALAALLVPARRRPAVTGVITAVAGALAAVAGVAAIGDGGWQVWLPDLLPLAGVRLALDSLAGVFVAVTGAVTVCAALYGAGYTAGGRDRGQGGDDAGGHGGHALDGRITQAMVPLFVGSLLLVPAADSVSTLLLAWELMAITSLLLVMAEHRQREAVREAAVWYAVMTHLGFVAILCGLLAFVAAAGGDSFEQLRVAAVDPGTRSAVFLATFAGFAAKAGIVPLHVWLPRAHPEAPSHVSALMSAAMVNMGVYGILRVGFDLLGGGPAWWWLVVLTAGVLSALYGILQAVVATDLKRLLGYSTTENIGLVLIGTGAAGFFAAGGSGALAGLALAAALLHMVNHSAFKTVLFLAAGSVLRATGSRDLDALGGLRERMPYTAGLFAVGALCASALPPGNAFVSEWLLLQSLIQSGSGAGLAGAVLMPAAVAGIALSAGLAVATFVKAFGVGFLARPRSADAERAVESPRSMVGGMGLAAGCCVALALAPALILPALAPAVVALTGDFGVSVQDVTLRVDAGLSTVSPTLIAVSLLVAVVAVLGLARAAMARRARRAARLWDCGLGPMSPRMEYTATSFAEPLQRVFDDVLAPESDVDVTPARESAYLVERVSFQTRVPDRIERRLYDPLVAAAAAAGGVARRLANGSVHRYLAYGFCALTGALVVLAVIW
ncbi:proton-conducting transporter transmembrane domain-containing protein [Acrocarpospora catenulata]|uniref:proton-conducting transporter transmembrane domain-containing protein n=1 Tax=Acrocarpospora catenulata TaxID=2836182 RepID=UPI001BD996C9|nr:proton-conducting transporter membrane subunit [Acrocarpospora catenulata]